MICITFLPFCALSFHFLMVSSNYFLERISKFECNWEFMDYSLSQSSVTPHHLLSFSWHMNEMRWIQMKMHLQNTQTQWALERLQALSPPSHFPLRLWGSQSGISREPRSRPWHVLYSWSGVLVILCCPKFNGGSVEFITVTAASVLCENSFPIYSAVS